MSEAKPGEFTLVYNSTGIAHPVALTKDQHQLLQVFLTALPGTITVIGKLKVETHQLNNPCRHPDSNPINQIHSFCKTCGAIFED